MIELADVTVIVVGFATVPAAVLNAMAPAFVFAFAGCVVKAKPEDTAPDAVAHHAL